MILSAMDAKRRLEAVRKRPANGFCSECSAKDTTWAFLVKGPTDDSDSKNRLLGCFVCYQCCAALRSLGTHIGMVKSVFLDEWSLPHVEALEQTGNQVVNDIWEAFLLDSNAKLAQDASSIDRLRFVKQKYAIRDFFDGSALSKVGQCMDEIQSVAAVEEAPSVATGQARHTRGLSYEDLFRSSDHEEDKQTAIPEEESSDDDDEDVSASELISSAPPPSFYNKAVSTKSLARKDKSFRLVSPQNNDEPPPGSKSSRGRRRRSDGEQSRGNNNNNSKLVLPAKVPLGNNEFDMSFCTRDVLSFHDRSAGDERGARRSANDRQGHPVTPVQPRRGTKASRRSFGNSPEASSRKSPTTSRRSKSPSTSRRSKSPSGRRSKSPSVRRRSSNQRSKSPSTSRRSSSGAVRSKSPSTTRRSSRSRAVSGTPSDSNTGAYPTFPYPKAQSTRLSLKKQPFAKVYDRRLQSQLPANVGSPRKSTKNDRSERSMSLEAFLSPDAIKQRLSIRDEQEGKLVEQDNDTCLVSTVPVTPRAAAAGLLSPAEKDSKLAKRKIKRLAHRTSSNHVAGSSTDGSSLRTPSFGSYSNNSAERARLRKKQTVRISPRGVNESLAF